MGADGLILCQQTDKNNEAECAHLTVQNTLSSPCVLSSAWGSLAFPSDFANLKAPFSHLDVQVQLFPQVIMQG